MNPIPEFVLIKSGPHDGKAVALLLHDYRTGKAWILKWRTSRRAYVKHPTIVREKLLAAPWNDPRVQAAYGAFERGEANGAIERLQYLLTRVFNQ